MLISMTPDEARAQLASLANSMDRAAVMVLQGELEVALEEVKRQHFVITAMRDKHGAGSLYAQMVENVRFQAERRFEALKQRNGAQRIADRFEQRADALAAVLRSMSIPCRDEACEADICTAARAALDPPPSRRCWYPYHPPECAGDTAKCPRAWNDAHPEP